ncbi:MAG: hypothetical protein IJD57_06490 [Candidatus Gastranaerophilales bacterium]|nr:hypothetical protein [Candidatus Gastranaerophilales bacterium]
MISELIEKFSNNEEVTSTELKEGFDEIFSGLAQESLSSSFLTALKVKKENEEDIFCAITSAKNAISKKTLSKNYEELVEYFTLADSKNYFDIQFASDIISSANNLGALRYCFSSPFYKTQPFETAKVFNLNFDIEKENLTDKFEQTNFAYIKLDTQEPYFKYTNALKRQLNFDNILNITDKFLNPYNAKNQIIGVKNKETVEKIASLCLKLNNSNSLILSSESSLPFVCPEGNTFVAEAWKDKIFTYNLNLELLGLKKHSLEEIKISSNEETKDLIFEVFKDKKQNAIFDFIVANSGLNLYICKKANSIIEGVELAKKTILDNTAQEKLEQIIKIFS